MEEPKEWKGNSREQLRHRNSQRNYNRIEEAHKYLIEHLKVEDTFRAAITGDNEIVIVSA